MTIRERLADLTIRWNEARLLALQLKGERNSLRCENEDGDENCPGGEPCWKIVTGWNSEDGEPIRPPLDEWCENCQKREKIHKKLKPVASTRGALMRAMQRCAARARGEQP